MSLSNSVAVAIIMCGLALGLTGCADNRLDGGYTAGTRANMQLSATNTQPSNAMPYVYLGGRDPVTGEASIRY